MEYAEAVESLSPEVVARLRQAVETGRWPDGRPVSEEQRQHSLQAVIAWEAKHLPESERVGFIDRSRKSDCGSHDHDHDQDQDDSGEGAALRWADGAAGEAS